jgi:hypothetical protein
MIILLSGWKRSGKDTAADMLQELLGLKRVSFASALKDGVAKEFKIDRASIDNQELKELPLLQYPVQNKDGFSKLVNEFMFREFRTEDNEIPVSFEYNDNGDFLGVTKDGLRKPLFASRRSLCILKGSVNRSVDTNYWVNIVAPDGGDSVMISDWRYKSEFEALRKSYNGPIITIRINRFDNCESSDPSERDLDNFDRFSYVIENKGSLEEFRRSIKALADRIFYDTNPSTRC